MDGHGWRWVAAGPWYYAGAPDESDSCRVWVGGDERPDWRLELEARWWVKEEWGRKEGEGGRR